MNLLLFWNFVNFFLLSSLLTFFVTLDSKEEGKKDCHGSLTWWQDILGPKYYLAQLWLGDREAFWTERLLSKQINWIWTQWSQKWVFFTDSVGWGSLFQKLIFELQPQLTDEMVKKQQNPSNIWTLSRRCWSVPTADTSINQAHLTVITIWGLC